MSVESQIRQLLSQSPLHGMVNPLISSRSLNFFREEAEQKLRDGTKLSSVGGTGTDLAEADLPDLLRQLKLRLATYLLAADYTVECIRVLESVAETVNRAEAAALWWLAQVRRMEQKSEFRWPPPGPFEGEISSLARAWLSASASLERGEAPEIVREEMQRLDAMLDGASYSLAHDGDSALSRALANLRLLTEAPPLAVLVMSYLAQYEYRAGEMESAVKRYQGVAERTAEHYPAFSLSASEAALAIRRLLSTSEPAQEETTDRKKQRERGEAARSSRSSGLAALYRRLSTCGMPEDRDLVQELTVRLASLQFADRLAGSLVDALVEPSAFGRALCRYGEYVSGCDFLLDTLQPEIVQEELKRIYRRSIPDVERIHIKRVWRNRRTVLGYEGVYAALAKLVIPLLSSEDPEDREDIARLRQLVLSGRAAVTTTLDQARIAAEALARCSTVADSQVGKENLELLVNVATSRDHSPYLRYDCAEKLTRYLDSWFEPDDLDLDWFVRVGENLAARLSSLVEQGDDDHLVWPLGSRDHLLSFLGQVVWAARRRGASVDPLTEVAWRLVQLPDPHGEHKGENAREIDLLWFGLTFGLMPNAQRLSAVSRLREILLSEVEQARDSGIQHRGIGVPLRSRDPLDGLREVFLGGPQRQRTLADDVLRTYASDQYLSDRHRLNAFHAMEVVSTEAPRAHRGIRHNWIRLAVDTIFEPVRGEETASLFDLRRGALQIAALRFLAACSSYVPPKVAARIHGQLESLVPLLRPIEKADYFQAMGRLMLKLPMQNRVRMMHVMLQETLRPEPILAASAWEGLVSGMGGVSAADQEEIERRLVQTVRMNEHGFPFRRIVMAHLAELARVCKLRLSTGTVDELAGICLESPFVAVRYHAKRLQKYAVRHAVTSPA